MNELSKKVIDITNDYLGPASERFVNRQVTRHLSIGMDELTEKNIEELAKWIEVSASLLIDKNRAAELAEKIKKLKD